ncbi:MAG: tetratricopeptide repeat protein [Nitrospirales bacterium]
MKRRLFQIELGKFLISSNRRGLWEQSRRPIFRLFLSLCLVVSLTTLSQVEGGMSHYEGSSRTWGYRIDSWHGTFPSVFRVNHDPAGPTMSHDYYEPSSAKLVRLIEPAHVNRILPNIQQSFRVPETRREGYLKSALREITYTLDRLVNHPKALALSASLGKLMGRPKMPVSFYQRAIALYPKRAMTHAQFGNFLVGVGDLEEGIERLKIAIKVNPKLAVSYGWLAWAYEENGQFELAQEYTKKAREKRFRGKLPKPKATK